MNKNNWKKVKLGEVCEIVSGGTPNSKNSKFWNGGIFWATTADVKQKYLYSTQRKITDQGLKSSSARLLPINTVLLSSRATVGLLSINKVEVSTNQGFKSFICKPKELFYEFLYYSLLSRTEEIKSLSSGTTYLEVSKSKIADFEIPLPPLSEQKEIVELCQQVEAKQKKLLTENLAEKDSLQKLRAKVLDMAIRGELTRDYETTETAQDLYEQIQQERQKLIQEGKIKKPKPLPPIDSSEIPFEIPNNWKWVRLGEVKNIFTGKTPSTNDSRNYKNEASFFKPKDLDKGYYLKDSNDRISHLGAEKLPKAYNNSILFVGIGATIGKTALLRSNGCFNQQIHCIQPDTLLNNNFLYFAMICDFFQQNVLNKAGSTTLPILNKSKFEKLLIPLPPLSEQKEIVKLVEKEFARIDELERLNSENHPLISQMLNQYIKETIF